MIWYEMIWYSVYISIYTQTLYNIYTYIYIYIHIFTRIHTYTYIYMYIHIWIYIYMIYIYIYIWGTHLFFLFYVLYAPFASGGNFLFRSRRFGWKRTGASWLRNRDPHRDKYLQRLGLGLGLADWCFGAFFYFPIYLE